MRVSDQRIGVPEMPVRIASCLPSESPHRRRMASSEIDKLLEIGGDASLCCMAARENLPAARPLHRCMNFPKSVHMLARVHCITRTRVIYTVGSVFSRSGRLA